jgi:hypothetical protein
MSDEPITIPVISLLSLADIERIIGQHAIAPGLTLVIDQTFEMICLGYDLEGRSCARRLVTELLHLARFAQLVLEIAECRPADTVVDVVNQVHMEIRSRP